MQFKKTCFVGCRYSFQKDGECSCQFPCPPHFYLYLLKKKSWKLSFFITTNGNVSVSF